MTTDKENTMTNSEARKRAQDRATIDASPTVDPTPTPDALGPQAANLDVATLVDRIRAEAAIANRPGQMQRLEALAAEVTRLKRGAATLGHIVESNGRMVLDITGLHDWIDEDGDGDWGAVWDHAYELRPRAEAAEAVIAKVRELADGDLLIGPSELLALLPKEDPR